MTSILYAPATLRLDDANLEIAQSASAVFVVTDKHPAGFLLTTCPAFRNMDDRYTVRAALAKNVNCDEVTWHSAEFVVSRCLDSLSRFLVPLSGAYDLNPCENDSMMVYATVLRFADTRVGLGASLRRVEIVDDATALRNRRIYAESSPFSLVNSALFHGYLTTGTIAYVRGTKNAKYATVIMSDMRYLDGMEGGIVFLDEAPSPPPSSLEQYWPTATATTTATKGRVHGRTIGLVVGMLHKMTGEGTMTIVAPWPEIFVALQDHMLQPSFDLQPAETSLTTDTPAAAPHAAATFEGVVLIVVRLRGGQRMWGSGILLDANTIVTNQHVVGKDWLSVTAWLSHTSEIALRYRGAPMDGLDLAFLEPMNGPIDTAKFRPAALASSLPPQGTAVRSVGYGLFYPQSLDEDFRPLSSTGILARVFSMPVVDGDDAAAPALVVSSAGCWNGSSGGAVLDERTGKVVGVMMSNGKDQISGEVLPDMSFVIPANLVRRALVLLRDGRSVSCTPQSRKLWKLRETYKVTLL